MRTYLKILGFLVVLLSAPWASATKSAELLTAESYGYGRVEARVRFAPGDGVVSSIFLWKDGSERAGTFWNELDFEKLGANCRLETNPIYGNPAGNHSQRHALELDLCGAFHNYTYEWTPEAIAWLVDGVEIRRETGAIAQAFAANASGGMQIRFNLWPGDASFGGNFAPASLPVHQYVDWVQFSAYEGGAFELVWREDFDAATLPAGWLSGNWPSPKSKSTHAPDNVNFIDGYAVLSLTADDALGPAGAMPEGSGGTGSNGGTSSGGTSGTSASGSSLGARPNVDGCSMAGGNDQRPVLGPLAALALALLSYRARRRDR
jgi:endo-1,3-1,4-beta-glycanase ExoK